MDVEQTTVVNSLKRVAKGSVAVLLGAAFYYVSRFLFRVLLARGLSAEGYGVISFSIALADTAAVVSLLGIPAALTRQIASTRSRSDDPVKVSVSGLLIIFLTSFLVSMLLFSFSNIISELFSVPLDVLRIFSISAFFTALLWVATAIAQGYEDVSVLVKFQYFFYSLFLVVSAVVAGLLFQSTFLAAIFYMCSVMVISTLALLYLFHSGYVRLEKPSFRVIYCLLLFSTPLFISSVISVIFGRMDTFMLGYFLGPIAVGVYNTALTVVHVLPFFLLGVNYMYLPIASSMASSGDIKNLKRFYQIITKWIVVFTLPLFAVVVLYPHVVLLVFFGDDYLEAAVPLMILSLAYLVHTSLGANGWTLVALGDTKFIFFYTVASAVVNFVLNAVLIPVYGVSGAAFATAVSIIFVNVCTFIFLLRKYKINPFTRHYVFPFFAAFTPLFVLKFLNVTIRNIFDLVLILVVYFVLYGILLFFLQVFEKEDIELFKSIRKYINFKINIL